MAEDMSDSTYYTLLTNGQGWVPAPTEAAGQGAAQQGGASPARPLGAAAVIQVRGPRAGGEACGGLGRAASAAVHAGGHVYAAWAWWLMP